MIMKFYYEFKILKSFDYKKKKQKKTPKIKLKMV